MHIRKTMDSDDNCLVIDEDAMDTEDAPEQVSVNKIIEKHNDERNAIEETNNVVEQPDNNAAPAETTTQPSVPHEVSTPKPKHRYSERSRRKDDKTKSTPSSSDKNRNMNRNKAHSIRFKDAVFKENSLNVSSINCQKP